MYVGLYIPAPWSIWLNQSNDHHHYPMVHLAREHQAPVTHLVAGGADHAEWLLSGDVAGAVPWIGRETGEKRRKIRENVGKHLGESEESEETGHRT